MNIPNFVQPWWTTYNKKGAKFRHILSFKTWKFNFFATMVNTLYQTSNKKDSNYTPKNWLDSQVSSLEHFEIYYRSRSTCPWQVADVAPPVVPVKLGSSLKDILCPLQSCDRSIFHKIGRRLLLCSSKGLLHRGGRHGEEGRIFLLGPLRQTWARPPLFTTRYLWALVRGLKGV